MSVYKLTAYPRQVTLRDGRHVTVRPMERDDREAIQAFFLRVPAEDRYFLKEDVSSPRVVEGWAEHLDYDRALPLIALDGNGAVVADAVLIRSRHGAYRDVAQIRVVVDPEHRNQGLGTALMKELCDIAADAGLKRVTTELVAGVQDDAIRAAEQLGFIRAATVHELFQDPQGRALDLVVLVLPLGKWYEWWQF